MREFHEVSASTVAPVNYDHLPAFITVARRLLKLKFPILNACLNLTVAPLTLNRHDNDSLMEIWVSKRAKNEKVYEHEIIYLDFIEDALHRHISKIVKLLRFRNMFQTLGQ